MSASLKKEAWRQGREGETRAELVSPIFSFLLAITFSICHNIGTIR